MSFCEARKASRGQIMKGMISYVKGCILRIIRFYLSVLHGGYMIIFFNYKNYCGDLTRAGKTRGEDTKLGE